MKQYGLSFHHLGLAVRNPERSRIFLTGLGYILGENVYDPLQNVNLIICRHEEMPDVELIFPADTPGPLERILELKEAEVYHFCYLTQDCEKSIRLLKENGNRVMMLSKPQPAKLFDGGLVSFYHIRGFGVIELLETVRDGR